MRIITSTHPHARLSRKVLLAAALIATGAVATLPPLKAMPPRDRWTPGSLPADSFVCPQQAPRINYCTNPACPHYHLRMNTGATNGGAQPGGSVGIRMRH